MKINGIDISQYGAELIDRQIASQNIKSSTDWLDTAMQGVLLRQDYGYRAMQLTLVVTAASEDEAYKNISLITEELKKGYIKFDDISLVFPCVMNGNAVPTRLQNGVFKVVYQLMNGWGIGDTVVNEFPIEQPIVYTLDLNYHINWKTTVKGYSVCFDENEMDEVIAKEIFYAESNQIQEAAAANKEWADFFLALGLDLDKHRPSNCRNGFVSINEPYDSEKAVQWFDNNSKIDVYYNRFSTYETDDLPIANYPSLIWQKRTRDGKWIDLQVGKGWDIDDISITVWGRFYHQTIQGNGCIFGNKDGSTSEAVTYGLDLLSGNCGYWLGGSNKAGSVKVIENESSSSNNIMLVTLEPLDSAPLRQYGLTSSLDSESAVKGFADMKFNGVTWQRNNTSGKALTDNLALAMGPGGEGQEIEISRVRVMYKGNIVVDAIPIDGNVKNGLINDYDMGFYDINRMVFLPYSGGTDIPKILSIPGDQPGPTPPPPPVQTYHVEVVNGTGTGDYQDGATVTITAKPAPDGQEFDKWVTSSAIALVNPTSQTTSFAMIAEEVRVEATYKAAYVEPKLMLCMSEEQAEQGIHELWAGSEGGDNPTVGIGGYVYLNVPDNATPTWTPSNSSYFTMGTTRRTFDGRPYAKMNIRTSASKRNCTLRYKSANYNVTQTFDIKSLFR